MKLNITDKAREELEKMKKGDSYFRLQVVNFSWSGVRFSIGIDKIRDDDEVFTNVEGFNFVIDRVIYSTFKRFSIDYIPSGLRRGFEISGYSEHSVSEE